MAKQSKSKSDRTAKLVNNFARNIEWLVNHLEITKAEAARRIGISRQQMNDYVHNRYSNIEIDVACRFMDGLKANRINPAMVFLSNKEFKKVYLEKYPKG